jgi:hypothetical protein
MQISLIAAILMLIGNQYLIKYKSWKAFVILIIADSLYLYYWFIQKEWVTFVLILVFLGQAIEGLLTWKKDSERE